MAKGSASKSQTAKKTPTTTSVQKLRGLPSSSIVAFAVQCDKCLKWRKLATEHHFEEFRCKQIEDPFVCNKLPGITCENPADITYDSSKVWAMDKPNIPKTPKGFKRLVTLRSDYSKMDVQYITPQGKKIRSAPGMVDYLEEHPEFSHIWQSDFCFTAPEVKRDTVPKHAVKTQVSNTTGTKRKKKKVV